MIREEKEFRLRFSLEAQFPDDYEGEADNHAWVGEWEGRIKPELIRLIFESVRSHPSWNAHIRNRGVSPLDEIEISMVRSFT